jgi:CubicO group peptidase (beta-lactamase class C family)
MKTVAMSLLAGALLSNPGVGVGGASLDVGRVVDALEAELKATPMPGAAVVVIHRGQVVLSRGFGAATPATLFPVGSVTKPVTAAAILSLVQDGTLRLDDRVDGTSGG